MVEARGCAMLCAVTGENEEASGCALLGTIVEAPQERS